MTHRSVCCCGRAVPLLCKVLEHDSATVAFSEYEPLLRKAHWILRKHQDIMLLRYLQGVVHKGRSFLPLAPLFSKDPEPCFASRKAAHNQLDKIVFSRVRMVNCKPHPA